MSQLDLAHAAGYSHSYIGKLERGVRRPTPSIVAGLAAALNLSVFEHQALLSTLPVDPRTADILERAADRSAMQAEH